MQGFTIPRLPELIAQFPLVKTGEDRGKYIRLALMTAMMSVYFERIQTELTPEGFPGIFPIALTIGAAVVFTAALTEKYSRTAITLFSIFLAYQVGTNWAAQANHTWLALWTIPVAILFPKWWEQRLYANYLRITLGIVMIGAAFQKLLAGVYLDGSYIAYLSHYGSTTENMFRFLCSDDTLKSPCGWHKFLGTFIVLWQIGVGLLLLAGVRSLVFLLVEVGFLLGAGIYADEMNFQVLNIALLCIAFRVGMSHVLFILCTALLLLDLHGIGEFIDYVV